MENRKSHILKRLLRGEINRIEAVSELQSAIEENSIVLVVSASEGLYDVGNDKGLTEARMLAKVRNRPYFIVDEESALLGELRG